MPSKKGRWKPCQKCGKDFWCIPALDVGSKYHEKKFCSEKCREKKYTPERAAEVFWSRVDKNGPNGCWLWTAARDKDGYGDLLWLGKHKQSHRVMWMLTQGDPGKLDVLHKCDNPPCCNPDHLYLGTDKENARDRVRAGTHVRGEDIHCALMTEDKVRQLRAERERTGLTYYKLGPKYGISYTQARAICLRKQWTHVE